MMQIYNAFINMIVDVMNYASPVGDHDPFSLIFSFVIGIIGLIICMLLILAPVGLAIWVFVQIMQSFIAAARGETHRWL
jgi:uncharacterized membrane protein